MNGLGDLEKNIISIVPILSLLGVGVLFHLMFSNYSDLGGWIQSDLSAIPYIVWVPFGGGLGYGVHVLVKKKNEFVARYLKKVIFGIVAWFFLSIFISLLSGDGNIFDRLREGTFFRAWVVFIFIAASLAPVMLGVYAVFSRKNWSIAASLILFFLLAASCMIFSQARSSSIHFQDPLLSISIIWCMFLFAEGINWNKRYVDRDPNEFPELISGKGLTGILWRRQLYFTLIFVIISSVIAYVPYFLVNAIGDPFGEPFNIFEFNTVFGKAIIGLALLLPLILFMVIRRRLEGFHIGRREDK